MTTKEFCEEVIKRVRPPCCDSVMKLTTPGFGDDFRVHYAIYCTHNGRPRHRVRVSATEVPSEQVDTIIDEVRRQISGDRVVTFRMG